LARNLVKRIGFFAYDSRGIAGADEIVAEFGGMWISHDIEQHDDCGEQAGCGKDYFFQMQLYEGGVFGFHIRPALWVEFSIRGFGFVCRFMGYGFYPLGQ
jgi:hypothetical protein